MELKIRLADARDLPALLAVKRAVWPEETARTDYANAILREPDHITLVADVEGQAAGFVDGFLTMAADGARRWEVDLLAVHPDYRSQGIARQLIAGSTEAGFELGAVTARALVKMDNHASQRAFYRSGYGCAEPIHALCISWQPVGEAAVLPHGAYLFPVQTFNYRGLWVESNQSQQALTYAQQVRARYGYDLVGAVIPDSQPDAAAAVSAGFTLAGHYQWFKKDAAPAPR